MSRKHDKLTAHFFSFFFCQINTTNDTSSPYQGSQGNDFGKYDRRKHQGTHRLHINIISGTGRPQYLDRCIPCYETKHRSHNTQEKEIHNDNRMSKYFHIGIQRVEKEINHYRKNAINEHLTSNECCWISSSQRF